MGSFGVLVLPPRTFPSFPAFGATPAASSTGGGLFGQSNPQTGGLFSTPASGSAFGAKQTGIVAVAHCY